MNRNKIFKMSKLMVLAAFSVFGLSYAGPLGPLPNVTSSNPEVKTGSCAVGDVVYLAGDTVPGPDTCERCLCSDGAVSCTRQTCEPRPGCIAVHRPDHCCPTYQCDCEQDGRKYANGEKLLDPSDPCRVCYCQGGEVVCRRIACFVRDDCAPRVVPGRCCPEYDSCPLRGVTTVPGLAANISTISVIEDVGTTPAPSPPPEKVKQEITIKEITPVSEIPVITNVKIKEILPSPSIEIVDYSSSKSPLIPREATTEKSQPNNSDVVTESTIEDNSAAASSISVVSSALPEKEIKTTSPNVPKPSEDTKPSKISLSTQDSINSDIYPSNVPTTVLVPPTTNAPITSTTVKPIEEDDPTLFDHNPAFPPLPDDLSVMSNHEDEISPEPIENDHNEHEMLSKEVSSTQTTIYELKTTIKATVASTTTPAPTTTAQPTTTVLPSTAMEQKSIGEKTVIKPTKETPTVVILVQVEPKESLNSTSSESGPMLNLRSAIPSEILAVPSSVPEDITGELDEETASTTEIVTITTAPITLSTTTTPITTTTTPTPSTTIPTTTTTTTTPVTPITSTTTTTAASVTTENLLKVKGLPKATKSVTVETKHTETTNKPETKSVKISVTSTSEKHTTSSLPKVNIATEVTLQTELSSLPIETSDQNPPSTFKKGKVSPTEQPITSPTSIKIIPADVEPITISHSSNEKKPVETTEITVTSVETTTDQVEVINESKKKEKSEAIIDVENGKKQNIWNDLIDLVGDVASMSKHTEEPVTIKHSSPLSSIPDSEELIPVNAGYKSKNSNFNLNSITEVPLKMKNPTSSSKTKVVEIEDDDSEGITDSPGHNDKVEPTTRRPIIDNVSDVKQKNETAKKDIEIITKSYVPTINRRPTKVVMKKNSDKVESEEFSTGSPKDFATETSKEASVTTTKTEIQTDGTLESSTVSDQ